MERTWQERKIEARKLINLPIGKRPANVVFVPDQRFDHPKYQVALDGLVVHFQEVNGKIIYLGEYEPVKLAN